MSHYRPVTSVECRRRKHYSARDFMSKVLNHGMPTPAQLGYSMPGEWEPHEATWLGWPHNALDWPGKFEVIRWVYGEMVRKISTGENVRIIVRHKAEERMARQILKHVGCDSRKIQFVV